MSGFVTTLARQGMIQKHQLEAAHWLAGIEIRGEAWAALERECRAIAALNARFTGARGCRDVFVMACGACRKARPFALTEVNLGLFREAMNAAHRVMKREMAA